MVFKITTELLDQFTCLIKHNGHHEEIQQEVLRDILVVKLEEDHSKAQCNKLVNGITK